MRILHGCNAYLKTGGIQTMVQHLHCELGKRGHTSAVLTTADQSIDGSHPDDGLYTLVHQGHTKRWIAAVKNVLRSIPNRQRVRHAIETFKPDLVHLHIGPLLDDAFAAVLDKRQPLLVTLHGLIPNGVFSHGPEKNFIKCLLQKADHVTCISSAVAADLDRFVPLGKPASVIYNGIPLEPMPDSENRRSNQLLFAGRLWPQKGLDVLIRALADLEDVRLWVAGDGPQMSSMKRLAEQMGPGKVEFLGEVEWSRLKKLMLESTVLVMPSRVEGMGMAALEAMSCGCPVIASDVGGLSEVIVHGRTGLLVPPDNPLALAAAIRSLMHDRDLQKTLSEGGLRHLTRNYALCTMTASYVSLYGQISGTEQ